MRASTAGEASMWRKVIWVGKLMVGREGKFGDGLSQPAARQGDNGREFLSSLSQWLRCSQPRTQTPSQGCRLCGLRRAPPWRSGSRLFDPPPWVMPACMPFGNRRRRRIENPNMPHAFECGGTRDRAGYCTLTSMDFGRAFSSLGRWMVSRPSLNSAVTLSLLTASGRVKARRKEP